MPPSDRGKHPKISPKNEKSKEIEYFLEFMQTYNDVIETVENDKKNLMKHLNNMQIIISQRYREEPRIVKIMNNLKLEVKTVTTKMKSEAEKDFSSVITRQPCQVCQGGRT